MQVHSVLESLQQGILICDQHSRIVFFNQVYSDFIGVPLETAKGQKITDYRKSAIAPEVIWSGIPVEGMVRREGTQEYFASVYPIWEEHHIRGSISIVTSLVQFEKRESEAHMTLEERVRRFERRRSKIRCCCTDGIWKGSKKRQRNSEFRWQRYIIKSKNKTEGE